jgi:hypothetical protein
VRKGPYHVLLLAAVVSSLVGYGVTRVVSSSPTTGSIVLLGDGVGTVRFGTSQSNAISRLELLFGNLRTANVSSTENCGVTDWASGSNVQFAFVGHKFVGFEIGSANAKIVARPDVISSKGLRLGDTIRGAEEIYGSSFTTSGAQGGSWEAGTPTGRLIGLLVGPPVPVGNSDQIEVIAAGYLGCPAMTP